MLSVLEIEIASITHRPNLKDTYTYFNTDRKCIGYWKPMIIEQKANKKTKQNKN